MQIQSKRPLIILGVIISILVIPFMAMQFSSDVKWSGFDFLIAAILLLATGCVFDLMLRLIKKKSLRILFAFFILVALFLVCAELAVGIFGTPLAGN